MLNISLTKSQRKLYFNLLPMGFSIVLLMLFVRNLGWIQTLELMLFDHLLYHRSHEPTSQDVIVVGITEDDLNTYGGFPLSNQVLVQALEVIDQGHPSVIGLDLFRESQPDEPERILLGQYLQTSRNIIGATVALNAESTLNIPAPPELKSEQVGFVDVIVDSDHKLRRMILASRTWAGNLEYSMALRLAKTYLQNKGIPFQHGDRSSDPIRLGSVVIPRVTSNLGGYQHIDANGNQMMINPTQASPPFPIFSLQDILAPDFDVEQLRDRVVVIGMTANSVKDSFINDAMPHTVLTETFDDSLAFRGRVYGVEFHAHAAHQLIQAAISGRPMIWALPSWLESGFILLAGLFGMVFVFGLRSPWFSLLGLVCITLGLTVVSMVVLDSFGLWLPLLPIAITLNATGLMSTFADRELRRLLDERHSTIIKTYEAVHNGPLQTLALVKREVAQEQWSVTELTAKLQTLNEELRHLYEALEKGALEDEERLILQSQIALNLTPPLDQLLHQVYNETLQRPYPGFSTLIVCLAPNFSGLEGLTFHREHKRKLCLFLEEALNNVGKHGTGSVSLDVSCSRQENTLVMKIVNKTSHALPHSIQSMGQGTVQAQALAQTLGGSFLRQVEGNQCICQLTWPIRRSPLQIFQWNRQFPCFKTTDFP